VKSARLRAERDSRLPSPDLWPSIARVLRPSVEFASAELEARNGWSSLCSPAHLRHIHRLNMVNMGLFSHNHQQKTISSNNLKYKLGFEFMIVYGWFLSESIPCPCTVLALLRWFSIKASTQQSFTGAPSGSLVRHCKSNQVAPRMVQRKSCTLPGLAFRHHIDTDNGKHASLTFTRLPSQKKKNYSNPNLSKKIQHDEGMGLVDM
jgi:hypothetical protein